MVFQGIQHRQTLFLQSVARSVDAGILLQEGAPERGEQYLPEDFLLREGSTTIGGTVYYSLCSPKLPGRGLALRVNTQEIVLEESLFLCVESQEKNSQASVPDQVSVKSSLVLPVQKGRTPGVSERCLYLSRLQHP